MDENKKSDFPQKFPIGPDQISSIKLNRILSEELTEWKIVKSPLPENPFIERSELFREYLFEDFDKVIGFINQISVGCNIFCHHPRWENTWTTLRVFLTTWDARHIISYKDIMLARFMDKTFSEYSTESKNEYTEIGNLKAKKDFSDNIINLIKNNNLEKAFKAITDYSTLNREKDISDELVLLTARFNDIQKEKRIGQIPWEDTQREIRQIRKSLLELLKEI